MRKFLIICAVEIGLLINLLWYWHNIPLYSPTVYWLLDSVLVSADDPPSPAPKDGKWTCAELQITLSFDDDDPFSTVVLNGRSIKCVVEYDRYSPNILVFCQELNDAEVEPGDLLFAGVIREAVDEHMVIYDSKQDREYTFYRETANEEN